jgi:hypothetical protein
MKIKYIFHKDVEFFFSHDALFYFIIGKQAVGNIIN